MFLSFYGYKNKQLVLNSSTSAQAFTKAEMRGDEQNEKEKKFSMPRLTTNVVGKPLEIQETCILVGWPCLFSL